MTELGRVRKKGFGYWDDWLGMIILLLLYLDLPLPILFALLFMTSASELGGVTVQTDVTDWGHPLIGLNVQ